MPSEELEENTVMEVLQKGYTIARPVGPPCNGGGFAQTLRHCVDLNETDPFD